MIKRLIIFVVCTIVVSGCKEDPQYTEVEFSDWQIGVQDEELVFPESGFVPDAVTAARIAEALFEAGFGHDVLEHQRPLRVGLRGKRWIVMGTLPENSLGGVAHVEIAKGDGRVLRMAHGK